MSFEEFFRLIGQMKKGSVPKRLIFIWRGQTSQFKEILDGVETHHIDLAQAITPKKQELENPRQILEDYLKKNCREYEDKRNEPSTLIIENSILLNRYGCDMSVLLKSGISPRSAVILVFPSESQRQVVARTEKWIKRNTQAIVIQVAKQLGEPDCIIET